MGNKLLYYLVVKPISLFPFWMLYGLSTFLKFILHRVVKYRLPLVRKNLKLSFPDKSKEELTGIENKFYAHLSDIMVESFKMFSISESEIKRRMKSNNSEIFEPYFKEGKDIILVSGHIGNWEMWASGGAFQMPHQIKGVYKPLKNKFLDDTVQKSRGRFGINLVSVKEASRCLGDQGDPSAVALLIDQAPARTKKCFWTTFLGRETAVNFGAEYMAKEYNSPVIYGHIQKVKRGFYEVTWSLITDNPQEEDHGFIMEKSTQILENHLLKEPHHWIWTHKRWKRERREDEPLIDNLKS